MPAIHPLNLRDLADAITFTRRFIARPDLSPMDRRHNAALLADAEHRYRTLAGHDVPPGVDPVQRPHRRRW